MWGGAWEGIWGCGWGQRGCGFGGGARSGLHGYGEWEELGVGATTRRQWSWEWAWLWGGESRGGRGCKIGVELGVGVTMSGWLLEEG